MLFTKADRVPGFSDFVQNLTRDEMHQVFSDVMDGRATDVQKSALLVALRMKGETPAEVQVLLLRALERRSLAYGFLAGLAAGVMALGRDQVALIEIVFDNEQFQSFHVPASC